MTKRARLTLSSPQESVKKRSSTFEVASPPSPRPTSEVRRQHPREPAAPSPAGAASPKPTPVRARTKEEAARKPPTWLNAGTIAKVLLIAGVTAVTILLLKRRLV